MEINLQTTVQGPVDPTAIKQAFRPLGNPKKDVTGFGPLNKNQARNKMSY